MLARKSHRGLWAVLVTLFAVTACSDSATESQPPTLQIAGGDIELDVGETYALDVEVEHSSDTVTFTSTDPTVASVTTSGLVTAIAAGQADIRASITGAEDRITVQVNEVIEVEISLTPESLDLLEGESASLQAEVTGSDETGVSFSSSNQNVATVDADGVVTGVEPGSALITATAAADESKSATAAITVSQDPLNNVSLSIGSVTQGGQPVDENNVSGTIHVTLNAEIPGNFNGEVAVYMGDDKAKTQIIGDGPAAVSAGAETITLAVNTAAYEASTGAPRYVNGDYTLSAKITSSTGRTWKATGSDLSLANADVLHANWQIDGASAMDAGGPLWRKGDAHMTVRPVMYSGENLQNLTVGLDDGAPVVQRSAVQQDGAFIAVFPRSTTPADSDDPGIGGVEGSHDLVVISSATAAGESGTVTIQNSPPSYRIDHRAPSFNESFSIGDPSEIWINGDFEFAVDDLSSFQSDGGVGGVSCVVYAGNAQSDPDSWAVVETGADLENSSQKTAYSARIECSDALENAADQPLVDEFDDPQTFGVDKTPPTIQWDDGYEGDPNPAGPFVFSYSDAGPGGPSGFGQDFASHRILRSAPSVSGEDACVEGSWADASCGYEESNDPAISVPTESGFYTFEAFVTDRAGNASSVIDRNVLIDTVEPSVDFITVPSPPVSGGGEATFSAETSDDLMLGGGIFWLNYGADALALSMDLIDSESSAEFHTEVTFEQAVARAILGIEIASGASPDGGFTGADNVSFWVRDLAGNTDSDSKFVGDVFPTPAADESFGHADRGDQQVTRFELVQPEDVCAGSCEEVDSSVTFTLEAAGAEEVFIHPFAEVRFYRVAEVEGTPVAVRTNGEVSITGVDEGAGERVYTFSGSWMPDADTPAGTVDIFALAIDEDGRALRSETMQITVVSEN